MSHESAPMVYLLPSRPLLATLSALEPLRQLLPSAAGVERFSWAAAASMAAAKPMLLAWTLSLGSIGAASAPVASSISPILTNTSAFTRFAADRGVACARAWASASRRYS